MPAFYDANIVKRTAMLLFVALSVIPLAAIQKPVPKGPLVFGQDGHFHRLTCSTLTPAKKMMDMKDAVIDELTPCPVCKPTTAGTEIATYVETYAAAVIAEHNALKSATAERRRLAADELAAANMKAAADKALADEKAAAAKAAADERAARPLVPLTEAQVRQIATSSAAGVKNDPQVFRMRFDERIRTLVGDYDGLFILYGADALAITIEGPVAKFESEVSERVRQFLPVEGIIWDPVVSISVLPREIGAPSIQRIVLQRNGALVAPLASKLAPKLLQTRMGAKEMIHEGVVTFPASAFAPAAGVDLKLTAIPVAGSNIVRTLTNSQLRLIR